MTNHNHYFRTVPDGVTHIDVYRLLDMFDVTCPVAQHVIKKALVAGQRGHKTAHRDWQDIADSAGRKLEMIQEDDGWNKESVEEAAFPSELYTEATESRMGVVGHDVNTAEHYPADEWIPNNGNKPYLPDGTRVDVKFSDGVVEGGRSVDLGAWSHDGTSDDITHYRIHQPE